MNKGFTLIELLAVIIILSVLAVITTVSVSKIISSSKESTLEIQKSNIEEAAKAYYINQGMPDSITCVNVSTLLSGGFIDKNEVKNPKTKENMNGSVKITYSSNKYSYTYSDSVCQ